MFKLESYITPVILSYVEKYVKNFKPEQSQVSLWGGDASFQNLDLRLEVLEEQLNLPFSFVSGHIHELLIHVPWVKINSEPIVITINTIECILKLKDERSNENSTSAQRRKQKEITQEEAPPGYIKSMVTRVTNNITINCNNLILKYVEEDIVLSINVRFLSMQTANDKWEPVFTDVGGYEVMLRKIITVQDLTLCLDKMGASGIIEIYQDPVLYRCSMMIRLLMNYHSNTAKRASITRLDLHCEKMEFSITEQQIPMLMRLFALLMALQSKQFLLTHKEKVSSEEEKENTVSDEIVQASGGIPSDAVGWGGWAWNTVSSILPVDWDNDWSTEQQIAYSGHTVHLGIYVDDATMTFKTMESVKEQMFYKSRKIRYQSYQSFLSLRFTGVVMDTLLQGICMSSFQVGCGSIRLYPRGPCSCGYHEVIDGVQQPPLYLSAGNLTANHLKDTLFDDDAVENQGKKRNYKKGISYHVATHTVSKLLERCPAFVMDYVYFVELPENINPEKIYEFGPSLEYSNLQEERKTRYIFGNLTFRLCSGICHRFDSIKQSASNYNYSPYVVTKPDPTIDELPPVTVEEYEALRENIPMVQVELFMTKGALQLQLADHRDTSIVLRQRKSVDNRAMPLLPALTNDPFVSIEWEKIKGSSYQPMYPFRLVACASKQTEISPEMLQRCYRNYELKVTGFHSQMHLKKSCHTSIVMPCSVNSSYKNLLYPQYWKSLEVVHKSCAAHVDSATITGTKAKIMVAASILLSIQYPNDASNLLLCSSLFNDACEEINPIYLELCLENINCKNVTSLATVSNMMDVSAVKVFVHNADQQAFILSGPEIGDHRSTAKNNVLLTAVAQYSNDCSMQIHPPLLSFRIAQMTGCMDPLFLQWLEYQATYKSRHSPLVKADNQRHVSEGTVSESGSKRRTFRSLQESVHSSSDKEKRKAEESVDKSKMDLKSDDDAKNTSVLEDNKEQSKGILERLMESYPRWSGLILNGYVEHIIVYAPSITMSGIGADGIEQAKDRASVENQHLHILVIKMPSFFIHSANIHSDSLMPYLKKLPVVLPRTMWTRQMQSFPWTLNVADFQCYTIKGKTLQNFVKNVTFNATIDFSTKVTLAEPEENKMSLMNLCVYVNTTPISVSISEEQVAFLSKIILSVMSTVNKLSMPKRKHASAFRAAQDSQEVLLSAPPASPTNTQLLYLEDTTTTSTVSTLKDNFGQEQENLSLTAWVQWTITKIAIKLYVNDEQRKQSSKLVLELEDIITSVDVHQVYLKLKHKITTAAIFHYTRPRNSQQWDFGEYPDGLLLCGREDNLEKGEDSGFLSLMLTIAKSRNVYTRWGTTNKPHKTQKKNLKIDAIPPSEKHIAEIDMKMQTLDIIVPPSIFERYIKFMEPFLSFKSGVSEVNEDSLEYTFTPPLVGITKLKNDTLPLIYLEFKGFRIMLPVSNSESQEFQHDLLMLQLDGISISPHAENPICRTPLRSDIYQLAAQANILGTPGSAVEDRQYQINVNGVCAYTTTWKNYQLSIRKRMSQSYLYTMNENPAVEWNKLESRSALEAHFSTFSIISRFDFCVIIAPTIVFKPDTVVCSAAAEINCLSDIETAVNLDQIRLISTLCTKMRNLFVAFTEDGEAVTLTAPPATLPNYKPILWTKQIEELDVDVAKDSGVDFEMSSVNSTTVGKPISRVVEFPPYEFLINCGKITFVLYEIKKSQGDVESQLSGSELEEEDNSNLKQPLLYAMINQANLYISQQQSLQKVQISCFDVALSVANEEQQTLTSIPSKTDFKVLLIETKNGELHPDTGIPPSFITTKCETTLGKTPQFVVNLGRPMKIHFSLTRLNELETIKQKVISSFYDKSLVETSKSPSEMNIPAAESTKKENFNTPDLHLTTSQIVLSFKSDSGLEVLLSLASLTGNILRLSKPERIYKNVSVDSVVVSVVEDENVKVLLNPWCCNVTVCLLWESWKDKNSHPQIQIQADSDSIYLDLGPKHIRAIKTLVSEYREFFTDATAPKQDNKCNANPSAPIADQHYKDDLKSGVFQFVDGSTDDLPYPYQVIFLSYPQQAMAWRYPQPRTLTRIQVSPVPFEAWNVDGIYDSKIPCVIEYWSENQMAYQRYIDFYLSETDSYRLDLPDKTPAQAAACVWRIVLAPSGPSTAKTLVATRALVACLQIDSYFNPAIIPSIQASFSIGNIHVSLYNHIDPNAYDKLPAPLDEYTLNGMIPEVQCFLCLQHKAASFVFNKWSDGSALFILSGTLSIHVLDYGLLILQEILDNLEEKIQLSISDKLDFSMTSKPFSLKFSPAISHTLAISARLWANSFDESSRKGVILTRYVIANDSNVPIRFGQSGTDDNILLRSRQCHFYSWRHMNNKTLRISIEENAWVWSRPFSVGRDGSQNVDFGNAAICVEVSSLSATQKLIKFSGQLLIANILVESFEMKLVRYEEENKSKSTVLKDVYAILGESKPSSIVLDDHTSMAMRLRFLAATNVSWTGDIPLQPNSKSSQPWLVKVPLQERGQFISIWVRMITEVVDGRTKILTVLSPLYMIQSHLPVSAKVQIDTTSLKTSLSRTVNGRGERQQLYCPGTFEHFHQLTFQLETGISASNPYVPLSYSSVDQRKFFKRPEKESIQSILEEMDTVKKDNVKWPFQTDEDCTWVAAEQPQTHVRVQYRDAGLASSTLLLELQPWCFILNSLGCHVSIVAEDVELCQIPHYGIVTPPKLDTTFHLGIGIGSTYYTSCALQLAKPDWGQSFYMPRIKGLIPVTGNTKISVDCGASVCLLNIGSSMQQDMRMIRISSNFVIGNTTNQELYVATLAVPETSTNLHFPSDYVFQSIHVLPNENPKLGTPIVQWHMMYGPVLDTAALYISLSLGNRRWSCPVKVDQTITRRCVSVPNGYSTLPVVVTTQEDKNTTYIMVHSDPHPQLFIENTCSFKILIGQTNENGESVIDDSSHFSWICEVESGGTSHYSVPTVSNRLPDAPFPQASTFLLLSAISIDDSENSRSIDKKQLCWSRAISLSSSLSELSDQFVRLPYYGDVKLTMQTRCYTTNINISPISQAEVSARDIRSKLIRKTIGALDEEEDEYDDDDRFPKNSDDERTFNVHSSGSSTSLGTFFSAQDETSEVTSSLVSTPRWKTNGRVVPANDRLRIAEESKDSNATQDKCAMIYLHGINLIIMQDVNENGQRIEVASLSLTDAIVNIDSGNNHLNICVCVGDLQLDNQMFDQGGFDFPVVFISQSPIEPKNLVSYVNGALKANVSKIIENSLISTEIIWEVDAIKKAWQEMRLKIAPISAYIEDTYITQLLEYATSMTPPCFALSTPGKRTPSVLQSSNVHIPDSVMIDAVILGRPWRLQNFCVEPISILLSVHTSVHLYLALDHSPLYFGTFEKKNLLTTPYRFGNAVIMHYLSGAIFGAGWVVGSLEIIGSPGGLAQALGSGLKDFVSMPFQGLLQGPWGFICGITHGSASLMKHVTAGTVNSVTKLASSVARNLDRLTLDNEHLQRQEESRRTRPQGVAQGFYQGLTGLGMNLLAAVAGLAHHPLQQVWSGESTTKGLVAGVGLGLVGVVTKPLSGAAELVALTGQGLLQGAGWNSLPSPRQRPVMQYSVGCNTVSLRYAWRLMPMLVNSRDSILHVANADHVVHEGSNRAVTLVLTRQALLMVNVAEDSVEKIFPLKDLTGVGHPSESTLLRLYCPSNETQPARSISPTQQNEMDQEMRARVAEFLRTSSTGLTSISTNSDAKSDTQESVPPHDSTLLFYVSPDLRNYLLSVFNVAKKQCQGNGFTVL